jgi:uncharacterized Zn-binding protein involved in type VI secretion
MLHQFFTVLTMIVIVAGITTVVVNGAGAAAVGSSFWNGFSGALTAAQGK